jgi:intracellular sulfur oxidation DsrE/DsrF family protein
MSFFSAESWTHRRGFLGRLAASTLALTGAAGVARPRLVEAAEPSPSAGGSEDWLAGITGTHRQFFDAVSVNDGFPFGFALNFLNTMGETYKVRDKDISAVVGLRHFAIPLVFNNTIWEKYKLGEFFKITDRATNAPAVRNPYAYVKEGELMLPGMAFEKLQARGVMFTCCNVALTVLSEITAQAAGLPKEGAKQEWLANMFKGVAVVPSGVLAVNRAQKKGCTYCFAG